MLTERIEFISEYCDRWCERCAFTNRCSSYAVKVALEMCGDFTEAIELAVGAPMVVGQSADTHSPRRFEIPEPTPEEVEETRLEEQARDRRIEQSSISQEAMDICLKAHEWFRARDTTVRAGADAVLVEAIEIAQWDSAFIGGKLARALHGRDRQESDDWGDDPIQNDWNGSAKIALISMERSESAWHTIAQATGDAAAAELASAMSALRGEVEDAFPFARLFRRPGFDELEGE